jgi:hypothetical protein
VQGSPVHRNSPARADLAAGGRSLLRTHVTR